MARLVRDALVQGGLGSKDASAPLCDIIAPGMTVLLKPNWVLHYNKSGKGMDCMVTHPAFIEAVLREVVKARPGKIIIGDAPIQSTILEAFVSAKWIARLKEIAHPYPLDVVDFRRRISHSGRWIVHVDKERRDNSAYILYDMGKESALEPVSAVPEQFRNTSYDHKRLGATHFAGTHQYLLAREIIESDVVINLPKLKAHRKAGLTAALKNIVGVNGDKDFLPHHRVGGSAYGGDTYPGRAPLKRIAEYCVDKANQKISSEEVSLSTAEFFVWQRISALFTRAHKALFGDGEMEGGWHGNDTVWRMVLDLNHIVLYGRPDGTLARTAQRKMYNLTDAIVAGEGLGPLSPEPRALGAVTFASSSAFADLAHSALMYFDWKKIPLVLGAFDEAAYPLAHKKPADVEIYAKGERYTLDEAMHAFGQRFKPAPGWQNHVEIQETPSQSGKR